MNSEINQLIDKTLNDFNKSIERFLEWFIATRCPDVSLLEFVTVVNNEELPELRQKDLIKEFKLVDYIEGKENIICRKYLCWKQ